VRRFELVTPGSVDDCLRALKGRGSDVQLLAGGTDLLPQLKNGLIKPGTVVDLSGVADLRVLEGDAQRGFRVGAAVTARTLERDPRIRATYPALAESAALVGSIQIRNLATVGGNLCNAAPSADMAPPLVALDAEAVIASAGGRRRVPVASFFSGVRRTVLAPDEPALFLYEVTNALAKRMQRRQLTLAQSKERLRFFLESGPLLKQFGGIHPRALELMERFGLPTAYDAHYLALAESERCECWTADERLWNSVKRELAWVRWIGEKQG